MKAVVDQCGAPTRRVRWSAACVGLTLVAGAPAWGTARPAPAAAEGAGDYGFHGEYADAQRGLVDLGQRWYDPRHQVFYSTDPAPADDPHTLAGDPRLTSSYTLNHHNSQAYADPDGRMPGKTTAPPIEADPEPVPYTGPTHLPGIMLPPPILPAPRRGLVEHSSNSSSNSSNGVPAQPVQPARAPRAPRPPRPHHQSQMEFIYECQRCGDYAPGGFGTPAWWWVWPAEQWLAFYAVNRNNVPTMHARMLRAAALMNGARLAGRSPQGAVAWLRGLDSFSSAGLEQAGNAGHFDGPAPPPPPPPPPPDSSV